MINFIASDTFLIQTNKFLNLIVHYKEKIENELRGICQDVLDLLDNNLINNP